MSGKFEVCNTCFGFKIDDSSLILAKLNYMTSFVNPERHNEIQRSLSAAKVYESLEYRKPAPKRISTEPVKQKRKLSRREVKELGLYALPSDTVQYKDAVPLHRLWCGYFSKFFQSQGTPDVTDSSYNMIVYGKPRNIYRFIGDRMF